MSKITDSWVLGQLETNGPYADSIKASMNEQARREQSEFCDGRGTKLRQYFGFNVEYVSQKSGATEIRVSNSRLTLIGSRIVRKPEFDGRPTKFEDEVLWAANFVKQAA